MCEKYQSQSLIPYCLLEKFDRLSFIVFEELIAKRQLIKKSLKFWVGKSFNIQNLIDSLHTM